MDSPSLQSQSSPPSNESATLVSGRRLSGISLALALLAALLFAVPFALGLRYGATAPSRFFLAFTLIPLTTPWLPALLAIVCGIMGRRRLGGQSETISGARWRALAGIVLGTLLLAINILLAIIALIAYLLLR